MINRQRNAAGRGWAEMLYVLCGLLVCGVGCSRGREPVRAVVRVASVPAIVEAPCHVAAEKGFFRQQGLDVELEINPDGKTSLQHLFEGTADFAAVMSTPVVYQSFERDDFCIVAKIVHPYIHDAVARKSSGIEQASDLRGKRLAYTPGTSGHFFMESWLLYKGIRADDVELVELDAPAALEQIDRGDVDAMFYWQPFPLLAQEVLGTNACLLSEEYFVPLSWVVVAKRGFVQEQPAVVERFLLGLMESMQFIEADRQEAARIHAEVAGIGLHIATNLLEQMHFSLLLDQALVLDLEAQARWLMAYGYVPAQDMPNYLDYVYSDGLQAVWPDRVTLVTEERSP